MKSYIQELKCGKCNNKIGRKAPVIESKEVQGTYLTVCPTCYTSLMTAGNQLISLEDVKDDLAQKLEEELATNMVREMKNIITKTDIINSLAGIIPGLNINTCKNENTNNSNNKKPVVQMDNIKPTLKATVKAPQKEIKNNINTTNDYETKYVSIVDGDVYDEYTNSVTIKEIFEEMIEEHGLSAILDGRAKLCELKEIKPKFREKTIYELDM